MSEILIRLADKTNPNDPAACAMCHKRGDAIVVMPDGHRWSERERAEKDWRILSLPLVSVSSASILLAPGRAVPGSGKLPTRRAYRVVIESLPDDVSGVTDGEFPGLLCPVDPPNDPRYVGPTNTKVLG